MTTPLTIPLHNGDEIILVGVPKDAVNFKLSGTNWLCYQHENSNEWIILERDSPFELGTRFPGCYTPSTGVIDFPAKEEWVGSFYDFDGIKGWYDYPDKKMVWNTPKQSLESLLKHHTEKQNHEMYVCLLKSKS